MTTTRSAMLEFAAGRVGLGASAGSDGGGRADLGQAGLAGWSGARRLCLLIAVGIETLGTRTTDSSTK
jgi:hypothetical protein